MKLFTPLFRTVCCGLLFLLAGFTAGAQIIYVTPNGAGDKSGSGWGNAMPGTQLQTAINNAVSGGQVWVAGGTYLPASSTAFSMKEGVKIYGGFAGTELSLNNRNLSIAANKSVLQGNGASVVRNSNNGLTNAAVLDGFTITGGTGSPAAFGPNTLNVGGGILLESVSPVISNCIVTNNHGLDAAAFSRYSYPVFYNCVFSYNTTAGSDYVIHITDGHAYLNNCTLSGNSGGYVIAPNFGDVTVSNCIVWGNSASSNIQVIIAGNAYVDHSIIQGGFSGSGNLNVDPLFVDAANGDFHLKPNSPAINTGDNSANSTATDLGGKTRIVGGTIDMGAYEFQCAPTIVTAQPQNTSVCTGGTATFTVGVTGPSLIYKWYKDGQSARSSSNSATLTINGTQPSDAGNYTVDIISDCGTVTSSAATLTVNSKPVVTAPANITTVSGDATCGATVDFAATATGTPAPSIAYKIGETPIASPYAFPLGATTVTVVATNTCGTDTKTFTVTVDDKTPPSFTVPADRDVAMGIDCAIKVPDLIIGLTGSDNCGTVTFSQNPVAGTVIASGHNQTSVVTITANDGHGNTTSHDVTLTAKDIMPPTITPPAFVVVPTDAGKCSRSNVALGTPSYSDKCSGVTLTNDAPAVFPKGITTVTWTVTDAAGNKGKAFQRVTVEDKEAPVVPELPAINAECSATVTPVNGMDNCDGAIVPTTEDALTYTEQGTYTIHWTYNDGNGNSIVKEQSVVIQDITKPQLHIMQLPDLTGECSVTVATKPTAYDNCAGEITATTTDPLFYDKQGTYTIHWVYYDGHYNYNGQEQTVIVKDVTKPVPDAANLPDISGDCNASVTTSPTATDNCAGTIIGTTTDPLSYSMPGSYVIHWTYNDGAGNSSTQEQNVTVNSIPKPVVSINGPTTFCAGGSVTLTAPDGYASYRWSNNATDRTIIVNQSGSYSVTVGTATGCNSAASDVVVVTVRQPSTPTSFPATACNSYALPWGGVVTASGDYIHTYTNADGCDSVVTAHVTINLAPAAPVITANGPTTICGNGSVTLLAPAGFASYKWSNNATSQSITVTQSGTYSVIVSSAGGCNSPVSNVITVTIATDNQKPVITCPAAVTLCYATGDTYTIAPLQATDNCGIASITYSITGAIKRNGSGANASGTFKPGTSTITWTVKDASGNTSTCQSKVVVGEKFTVSIPDGWALGSGCVFNTVYKGYKPAEYILLVATVSDCKNIYSYKWSNGATTKAILVNPQTATTYTVTVKNAAGCTQTASKQINVVDVRCGSKMDKVTLCYKNQALCVEQKDVAGYLFKGAYLGACKAGATTKTMVAPDAKLEAVEEAALLELTASPNPSTAYFNLQIKGKANEKITLVITDMLGRNVESRVVTAGSVQIGATYRQGVYIATLVQGDKRVSVKLIKQG